MTEATIQIPANGMNEWQRYPEPFRSQRKACWHPPMGDPRINGTVRTMCITYEVEDDTPVYVLRLYGENMKKLGTEHLWLVPTDLGEDFGWDEAIRNVVEISGQEIEYDQTE